MTREKAIIEIKNLAVDYELKFEEAALESLYTFYEAAGFDRKVLETEFGYLNTEQLINAYIRMRS